MVLSALPKTLRAALIGYATKRAESTVRFGPVFCFALKTSLRPLASAESAARSAARTMPAPAKPAGIFCKERGKLRPVPRV